MCVIGEPCNFYRPQQSCEGYVFTGVCLSIGGVPDKVHPPGTRYTPRDQVHPPLGPGTPPRTRYTSPDQVYPLGTRYTPRPGTPPGQVHPPDQVHPPGPGTPPRPGTPPGPGTPPWTRYTPRTRYTPLVHPPDQVPPGPGTPSPRDTATAADGTHPTGMHSCSHFIFTRTFDYKKMCTVHTSGPSKGGAKFFLFHAVFGKENRLAYPFWELAPPPSGKSWIRHCTLLLNEMKDKIQWWIIISHTRRCRII